MSRDANPLDVLRRYRPHDFGLFDFLASRVEAHPHKEALVFEERRWTYRELQRDILRAASMFNELGVVAGDRVGVLSTNHPSTVVTLFALAALGAIMAPANPAYTEAEAHYVFHHAGIVGLIAAPAIAAVARAATADMSRGPWLLVNEPAENDASPVFDDLLTRSEASDGVAQGAAASPALIIYTSGTTGFPKGVQHSQRGIVITGESFVGRLRLHDDDRVLCVMPMFHINALMYSTCGAFAAGATLIVARRFSASNFWTLVAQERVTQVNLVPAPVNMLFNRPRSEFRSGHAMKKMFVAPATTEMVRRLSSEFEVDDVIECYGMSEVPGLFANPFEGPRKIASMGTISPHPDPAIERPMAKVVDAFNTPVDRGQTGQLLVRTPTMMQAYFEAPELTAAALCDGWFATGDLVRQDEDGFFFYVGRMNDMLRRRGENISGVELERALGEHPDVLEVAAVAVPSPLGEDDIMIVAVPRSSSGIDPRTFGAWARQRLSAAKRPRYVVLAEELPRTPTQRIQKFKLRNDAALLARAVDFESQ